MSDENSASPPDRDLFGRPLEPIRDRRGRKSFKKDKENQEFVSVRIAAGWSQKRIAEDMGIDEKTLRKYFSRELENGTVFIEGMLLDVLVRKAREGHTPSVRRLQEVIKDAVPQAPRRSAPEQPDRTDQPARPLGKKEQAQLDAQKVPDEYGDIFARRRH